MWDFFIRKSRFAYLLMITLIGFGLYAIAEIPKESAPEVQIPVGIVTTVLPGASALDVENLVTNEIERALDGSLDNVEQITSSSREGISSIIVEFNERADIDDSIRSLRNEVDALRNSLPTAAEDPSVSEIDFVDQPIYTFAVAGDLSPVEFITVVETLEDELLDIRGVSRVEVRGNREREVHVLVDRSAATTFSVSLQDIAGAIDAANAGVPVGEIVTNDVNYNIVFESNLTDPAQLVDLPIKQRGGSTVFLRDVATIIDGVSFERTRSRLSIQQAPALAAMTFDVYKQRDADIMTLTNRIEERISELQNQNDLADLTFETIQDLGQFIADDLIMLSTSGLQTAALVMVLLIITLGWREGIIAGTAIPLSFTIAFIGLWLSGNTINFISLFALILGIGILVDSSIVMVEGINKRMKQDPDIDKTEAAVATIKAFAKPIIAGTLTTIAVFSGLFIVSGVTGQFIASIPFTLVFLLSASLLVAIGFIPLLSATFLRRRSNTKIEQLQVAYANQLESWYTDRLQKFLASGRQRVIFVLVLLVGFVSSFALIPLGFVQVIFFGAGDSDTIFVELELPAGTTLEMTDRITREAEDILYEISDIESFISTVGSGSAFLGQSSSGSNIANINILLREERERDSNQIRAEIRERFTVLPNTDVSVNQPDAGPPTGSPISISLFGQDLDELSQATELVSEAVRQHSDTTNVRDGITVGANEFVFRLDRALAAENDLTPFQVSQTLRGAVTGLDATTINTIDNEIPVTVRLNLDSSENPNIDRLNETDITTLQNLTISTPAGRSVILDSVLETELRQARSVINHQDRERVETISADVVATANVREVTRELQQMLSNDVSLPEGVQLQFGGETDEADQGFADLFLALIVGIVLMIAVLVLQFNSYRYPIYVLSIVPFSLMGILYGLAIVGSPLSFPSIMGFVALTGIVVNNSILLIDMINNYRHEQPEAPVRDMVVNASASRVRPILLTTITTVLGISPLLLTDPVWIPLATAIMFGLSFSVVITLILVPLIYDKWPGKLPN